MKLRKVLLSTVLGVALAISATGVALAAEAPGNTATCKFVYERDRLGEGFTVSGNTVSVNVIVTGNETCRKDFVLAAFKIPHDTLTPFPEELQTLFDYTVLRGVGPGTYKMTVKIPDCFYQVDLTLGTNPTGPNGRLPYEANRMLNSHLGGTQKCVDQPVVTPPVVTPAATTPAPRTLAATRELPKTGPGSVFVSAFSIATISGVLHNLYTRRRK